MKKVCELFEQAGSNEMIFRKTLNLTEKFVSYVTSFQQYQTGASKNDQILLI